MKSYLLLLSVCSVEVIDKNVNLSVYTLASGSPNEWMEGSSAGILHWAAASKEPPASPRQLTAASPVSGLLFDLELLGVVNGGVVVEMAVWTSLTRCWRR